MREIYTVYASLHVAQPLFFGKNFTEYLLRISGDRFHMTGLFYFEFIVSLKSAYYVKHSNAQLSEYTIKNNKGLIDFYLYI